MIRDLETSAYDKGFWKHIMQYPEDSALSIKTSNEDKTFISKEVI